MSETVSILFAVPVDQVDSLRASETLRSIQSQTFPESLLEVHKVQYVPNAPEAHTSALNAAREIARASSSASDDGYMIYAEPGLLWEPGKIERQVLALQDHPGSGGCVHPMSVRPESGRPWTFGLEDTMRYGARIASFLRPPWGHGTALLRSTAAARVGVFRNVDQVLWEYAIRTALRTPALHPLPDDLATWNPGRDAEGEIRNGRRPIRPLVAAEPNRVHYPFLKAHLDRLTTEDLFQGHRLALPDIGLVLHAALHLNAGDFAGGFERLRSQESNGLEGGYLVGLLERGRGNFQESEAAVRRCPASGLNTLEAAMKEDVVRFLQSAIQLPDYGQGRETAGKLLNRLQVRGGWDTLFFTELCQEDILEERTESLRLLAELQQIEYDAFFEWTFRLATGSGSDPDPPNTI